MDIPREHNPQYSAWFVTDVIHAMENYGLMDAGGKVGVALSGGRDSVTLLYILWYIRRYSHMGFDLCAIHVRIDDYDTSVLRSLCDCLDVPYIETDLEVNLKSFPRSPCSLCAAFKRGAMARALEGTGTGTVAFGHHADDAAETLLMNIVYNRRLSTLAPKVVVPEGTFTIIRPLVYLTGSLVRRLHRHFRLPVLEYSCPHGEKGSRALMRLAIARIEELADLRDFSRNVVAALENVDYPSLWPSLRV